MPSEVLTHTYAHCFIKGETKFLAIGGNQGEGAEIWDIETKQAWKVLDVQKRNKCLALTNNILAVASGDGKLTLWDVRKWEVFHSMELKPLEPFVRVLFVLYSIYIHRIYI